MSENPDENPPIRESREGEAKPDSSKVNLALMFGFGNKDKGKKEDPSKAAAHKPDEKKDHQDADTLLSQWPEKTPDQAKTEFMSGAENILTSLAKIETSCEFNGVREKYEFSCGPKFLVNGQPAELKDIKDQLKSGAINTSQISLDMRMDKVNGKDSSHMKIAIPLNEYLNGGARHVEQKLGSLVQTLYGAASQNARNLSSEQRTGMLTTEASAEMFRANREMADRVKAMTAGKECSVVEFNNPQSRETLLVIDIPKKGTQISLSLSGGAISRASSNGKALGGGPQEILNVVKNA